MATEYYGPPECDADSLTGWTVTEYYQAPVMVCWPVCRMNQHLGMRLFLWTDGAHGLRYVGDRHGPSVSPVAHDADAHEGSVCVKRFCGPVYVLVDLSYISQPRTSSSCMLQPRHHLVIAQSGHDTVRCPEQPNNRSVVRSSHRCDHICLPLSSTYFRT